jgi:hypothetical protein
VRGFPRMRGDARPERLSHNCVGVHRDEVRLLGQRGTSAAAEIRRVSAISRISSQSVVGLAILALVVPGFIVGSGLAAAHSYQSIPASVPLSPAANWTQLSLTIHPPPCYGQSMVYDGKDGAVILFGGICSPGNVPSNSTWSFAGGVWKIVATTVAPPPRESASMAYDAKDGYVLLFGGFSFKGTTWTGSYNDTWKFAGGTWTNITPAVSPSPRVAGPMTYDAKDGYVVLFGGAQYFPSSSAVFNDTWAFSAGGWTNLTAGSSRAPSASYSRLGSMTFDSHDRYVLYYSWGQTWKFVAGRWTVPSANGRPAGTDFVGLTFDTAIRQVLEYGGQNSHCAGGGVCRQTWAYANGAWSHLFYSTSPPPLALPQFCYDPRDGYAVLFGGDNRSGYWDETWTYG